MIEVLCLVWMQASLGIIYDFVKAEGQGDVNVPFNIPQFCFVKAAIVIEQSTEADKLSA